MRYVATHLKDWQGRSLGEKLSLLFHPRKYLQTNQSSENLGNPWFSKIFMVNGFLIFLALMRMTE